MDKWLTAILTLLFFAACGTTENKPVILGIDRLVEEFSPLIEEKRISLIPNPSGGSRSLQSDIDLLYADGRFDLTALFGPEHGVRGDVMAGHKIADDKDPKTGVPVYSLYGKTFKPTPEMLVNVDILLFNIQDIGIRPYTYIYTMSRAMEAAKEQNIPFVVLDRPNPLGGTLVEGAVLKPEFKSGIGLYPIPYIHGMTVGELAKLFNEEFEINCELTIVPMKNWRRNMIFQETGLTWIPTSPHVPHPETCFYIAATGGFGELETLSPGVGTPQPFELCGAPWIDGENLANVMNELDLPGVYFRPLFFRPYYLRFVQERCGGVQLHIRDYKKFKPIDTEIRLLAAIRDLFPEHDYFDESNRTASFDRAYGTDQVRKALIAGKSADEILASWQEELEEFMKVRQKYLIYD